MESKMVGVVGGGKFIRQPQIRKKVNKQTKDKNERNVFTQKFITLVLYIYIGTYI